MQQNQRLPSVLETFSSSIPPPTSGPPIWSLDALFALPRARIRYYQKLYNRLAKSSQGKNAEKLQDAVQKLGGMLTAMDERSNIALPGPSKKHESIVDGGDEVVMDTRGNGPSDENNGSEETVKHPNEEQARGSSESSARGSSSSG